MKQLHCFYHSQSGRSEQLAFAFYQATKFVDAVNCQLKRVADSTVDDLLSADAWVFFGPENFAAAAGGFKDFFDRVYYPFERSGEKQATPFMLVLSAGNDGSNTDKQLQKILTGMRAKKVQETLIIYGPPKQEDLQLLAQTGEAFAEALAMGAF